MVEVNEKYYKYVEIRTGQAFLLSCLAELQKFSFGILLTFHKTLHNIQSCRNCTYKFSNN